MKGLKKISSRIFFRIFIGTLSIISLAAVVDYFYSKDIVSNLVRDNVNRAFSSAYSELGVEVGSLVSKAKMSAHIIAEINLEDTQKVELQNHFFDSNAELLGVGIFEIKEGNTQFYAYQTNDSVEKDPKLFESIQTIFRASHESEMQDSSEILIQLKYDTICYYYRYKHNQDIVYVWFDVHLDSYLKILKQNIKGLPAHHYLFDKHANVVLNDTRRYSAMPIDKQTQEIKAINSFIDKNMTGLILEPALGKNNVIYIGDLKGTNYKLASVIRIDKILRRFRIFTFISYLIKFFAVIILAYVLQRIIRRLTRPIAELTELSRKIEQGGLHIEIPEYDADGETAQLSNALRAVQLRMKRYVSSLNTTLKSKRAIEHELKIANKIQFDMIPAARLALTEVPEIDMYAEMIPAKGVAGDFYDYFFIDSKNLFFVIGDVSGKGIPAALFMVKALTLLKSAAKKFNDIPQILQDVNTQLCQNNDESMFVTAIAGIIHLPTGKIEICDAGHNPPVIIEKNIAAKYLELNKGMPLGIMEDAKYTQTNISLNKKNVLFFYTDGFPECANHVGSMLGEEAFLEMLDTHKAKTLPDLASAIWGGIEVFRNGADPNDDTTFLIIDYCADK